MIHLSNIIRISTLLFLIFAISAPFPVQAETTLTEQQAPKESSTKSDKKDSTKKDSTKNDSDTEASKKDTTKKESDTDSSKKDSTKKESDTDASKKDSTKKESDTDSSKEDSATEGKKESTEKDTSKETATTEAKPAKTIKLVLDPGHGGDQSGAEAQGVLEKDVNLKIARYLKDYLESTYKNVEVSLTRDEDTDLGLKERVQIAADLGADMLISLHNNAAGGETFLYKNGCTVLTAQGNYRAALAKKEQNLAACILYELEGLSLDNQGILLRNSETGDTYENGNIADYYAIIRTGINMNVPSILIEHAFMDDENDFEQHLSSDEKIKELALADARGIARYYGLIEKKTSQTLPSLQDYEIKLYHIVDEDPDHTVITKKVFYPTNGEVVEDVDESTGDEAVEDSTEEGMEENSTGQEEDTSSKEKPDAKDDTGQKDKKSKGFIGKFLDMLFDIIGN